MPEAMRLSSNLTSDRNQVMVKLALKNVQEESSQIQQTQETMQQTQDNQP